jgi:hypothetical protein
VVEDFPPKVEWRSSSGGTTKEQITNEIGAIDNQQLQQV